MRIIALIDEAEVMERALRHLGWWETGVRVGSARDPYPGKPDDCLPSPNLAPSDHGNHRLQL